MIVISNLRTHLEHTASWATCFREEQIVSRLDVTKSSSRFWLAGLRLSGRKRRTARSAMFVEAHMAHVIHPWCYAMQRNSIAQTSTLKLRDIHFFLVEFNTLTLMTKKWAHISCSPCLRYIDFFDVIVYLVCLDTFVYICCIFQLLTFSYLFSLIDLTDIFF